MRHPGPPGRNAILGHVVAEYSAAGSQDVTSVDVPLQAVAKPNPSAREAVFSFAVPHESKAPLTIRLRYVDTPFKQPAS